MITMKWSSDDFFSENDFKKALLGTLVLIGISSLIVFAILKDDSILGVLVIIFLCLLIFPRKNEDEN